MGLRDDLEHVFLHVLLGRSRGGGTVRYVTEGLRSRTIGLRAGWAHPELEVEVSETRLTEEANLNGSRDHIAGICSRARNVLGLMPHPERACEDLLGSADGSGLFRSLAATLAAAR